ncbi:hypothetical protein PPYR_06266 [Photinus pyralis]|uniref:RRM domain-containing protein n=1 Tax=Photinus pyralis TaxID=7054 RepID=A0A1Y1LZM8_PHOPY|nr:eukaryotic translation initiation factor 4B [Photinus pyralis]KAB0800526.1 hypothetical protein PPYR_06266 [Photinus pyralis]
MASSGKKGKKTKGKTLALNDFLQETPGTTPTIRKSNWADEVEDNYDQYESRPKDNVILPTAPKSARGFDEFSERIPQNPPFNAYITNLPYDVRDEEIAEFFGGLKIANMRIPREERTGEPQRLKGYGYVEFADRDSLIGALNITACTLKNRRIRIEVADNSDNDRKRGGRMDNNRDRSDRSEITSGDWRSRPRVDPPEMSRSRNSGFSRDRDNAPMDRDKGGSWRDNRDRPNFKEMDRGKDGFGDRGRFSDKDGERRGFGPRRNEDREFSRDSAIDRAEPRTRPKLMLQQRSIPPQADVEQNGSQETSNTVPTSSSIFGGAKPVDTSIRERQIEELLAKQSERHASDSRESRRDDRRDWNRRDDEGRWGRDKRKDSPIRRTSPDYRNDHSPVRNRNSYNQRGDSPRRKYSPERRRRSPEMKRDSPERRRWSPEYRRDSPDRRRRSPDSPERRRRKSPDYRDSSPIHRRNSLDRRRNHSTDRQRRNSPDNRRNSPDYRGNSAERSTYSSDLRRDSPTRRDSPPRQRRRSPKNNWEQRTLSPEPADRSDSPEQRQISPERKKKSPDRSKSTRANQRKNDDRDKKGSNKNEKSQKNDREKTRKDEKTTRENHEREMPKVQEPETPNFAVSNKYAFLPEED